MNKHDLENAIQNIRGITDRASESELQNVVMMPSGVYWDIIGTDLQQQAKIKRLETEIEALREENSNLKADLSFNKIIVIRIRRELKALLDRYAEQI